MLQTTNVSYSNLKNRGALVVLLLLTVSSLGHTSGLFSRSSKGTTGVPFLKMGAGARASGMGEAYSAVSDDASALYWNPAGLVQVPYGSLTFMHASYIESSFYDYTAYAQNLGPFDSAQGRSYGVLGVGAQFFSVGSITQTDTAGNEQGTLNPNDMAVSLGYAHTLGKGSLGLTGKFIRSTLINTAQTEAVDVGFLSPGYFQERLKLSMVLTNLGGQLKYDKEGTDLPLSLRLGGSLKISPDWILSCDGVFPNDNNPYTALGTEYNLKVSNGVRIALRMGGNSRILGDVDGLSSLSVGSGISLAQMSIDYAFLPMGSLGITHRFSLSYHWGPKEHTPPQKTPKRLEKRPASMRELFRERFGSLEGPEKEKIPERTELPGSSPEKGRGM